jgi:hypothetical protein
MRKSTQEGEKEHEDIKNEMNMGGRERQIKKQIINKIRKRRPCTFRPSDMGILIDERMKQYLNHTTLMCLLCPIMIPHKNYTVSCG